ncbi:hypothetical protein PL1_1408 [Paenibacillus larvae subsp. larvae B-3650]|nr:hypothetical protein PL1_1408 [Paenibacillus larvae subsp. larvae B-3650]
MFQFIEKTFDQVPFFKEPPVGYTLNGSMFTAGNDGTGLLFFQQRNNFIGVVPTISQDVFTFDIKVRIRLRNRLCFLPSLRILKDCRGRPLPRGFWRLSLLATGRCLGIAAPFCPRPVLVNTDNGGIEHDAFIIGIGRKDIQHAIEYACFFPSAESGVYRLPRSVVFGQIAPRRSRTDHPKHRIEHLTVILGRAATLRFSFRRQHIFDLVPLIIS